jgi:hypothetical protein
VEQEPNQPCTAAQALAADQLPFKVDGSLDSTPDSPDVDFFKFTGTPGVLLTVDLEGVFNEKEPLQDPFLGLFDSACHLVTYNDDSAQSANSKLVFSVPADGIFILAATRCCDTQFVGGGVGAYEMTISHFATIGSISGRIVDAITGNPLPGSDYPFPSVRLSRCGELGCDQVSFFVSPDSEGRFFFDRDFTGKPLEAGTFQITAEAQEYQRNQTEPFAVGEGEKRDLGDVPLLPAPVEISDLVPCENLPPGGGRCSFSLKITNRLPTVLDATAWSIVSGSGIGSILGGTTFETGIPKRVLLAGGKGRILRFAFDVPSTVQEGALICVQTYVGQGRVLPFFRTVEISEQFCIQKQSSAAAFSVVTGKDAQRVSRRVNTETLKSPKRK